MRSIATSPWLRASLVLGLCAAALTACADAPLVLQGTVVTLDEGRRVIAVRDERPPHAVVQLAVDQAEVGARPQPGDLVRVAYRAQGDVKVARRLMNLSRQAELKKAAGGH